MALPENNAEPVGGGLGPSLAEFTRQIAAEIAAPSPELPSFPEVALRVRQALSRSDINLDEVVRIVGAEPSLSVRLLQLSNSVALNPGSRRITTLRAAITRLGFNMARSATVAFAMSQMRRAEAWRGLEARFREVWEMSARLAATSYALARHCGRVDADQALLAGMLSAVGKLFVMTRVSRFPVLFADAALSAEIENVWQARAGRALLVHWELGDEVLAAACEYERALTATARVTLSDVLLAARHLTAVADPAEMAGAAFLASAPFARLGLDGAAVSQVVEDSSAEIASLRAALAD
jgi:HD-like signal output (HDOD) protein